MTKTFDERHAAKSRAVCAGMAEEHATEKRVLTERERQILDMWPRFEDGELVLIGEDVIVDNEEMPYAAKVKKIGMFMGSICVYVAEKPDGNAYPFPIGTLKLKHLDSEPADSWERLEEDAAKSECEYFGFSDSDGCPGCPAEKCGMNCYDFKALDILRRAKALAGVK